MRESETHKVTVACSFCKKKKSDAADVLVVGPGVSICGDCARLCLHYINQRVTQMDAWPTDKPQPARADHSALQYLQYRILTHYTEACLIANGKMPAPRTAIVYPTYICNQNCVWCEYAQDNAENRAIMPDERLFQLLEDLRDLGVRGVEFCGGGEPTLHPQFTEAVRRTHKLGMGIGLLTNGTMLKGELAGLLVDTASYVRVGFDAASGEMMDRVKRPNSPVAGFDAVCANIANMVQLRNERDTRLLISMKVVLDATNYGEVEDCVKLALKLGVDSIQFKAARLCDTELTADQATHVGTELRALRARYPELPIVGGVEKLNMTTQCWLTPLQVTIDPLGDVYLCCYYRHRKESHCIGNAFSEPLRDVWYSQRHQRAIRAIKPLECNVLDCRFVHYNRIMSQLLTEGQGQFEFI